MFQFLDNERRSAFAHDESIAQRIKWAARDSGVARPSAHGFDNVECANRDRCERRFRSACHDYVREIVANVTKCFADGDCATGATV
jgi:hypothetical protein